MLMDGPKKGFKNVSDLVGLLRKYVHTKETKGRSSGQTPFTPKPKQLALKKTVFY